MPPSKKICSFQIKYRHSHQSEFQINSFEWRKRTLNNFLSAGIEPIVEWVWMRFANTFQNNFLTKWCINRFLSNNYCGWNWRKISKENNKHKYRHKRISTAKFVENILFERSGVFKSITHNSLQAWFVWKQLVARHWKLYTWIKLICNDWIGKSDDWNGNEIFGFNQIIPMQRKAPFICRFACRSINVDPLIVKTARKVCRKNVNKNEMKLLNNRRHHHRK